jgi:hypothetical protein
MGMKPNLLKRTFADVYGSGYSPTNFTGPIYTSRITPSTSDVYVHDSVFSYCSSTSNGGALYCDSNVLRLLIEQSSFISCRSSSSYGGTIYFSNSGSGEYVLSRICGFNCSSSSNGCYGQFLYVTSKYRSHINESSIAHSIKETSITYSILRLWYGSILCPSLNLSSNVCYSDVLHYYPTTSDTFISYSSIVNNTADGGSGCINLNNGGYTYIINTCNILNNKQTSSSSGTIHANNNLLIKDSCILGNNKENANTVFYASSSAIITISNCTFDNNRYYGNVITSKTVVSSFINALSHISTQRCDSYFDSYGTLTVKPNAPTECPRCLISCNNKHLMIDLIRSFEFTFLLSMIPLDSA